MSGGIAYSLAEDKRLFRETLARITATGVGVLDLELIRLDQSFNAAQYLRFLEIGAELGARAILVVGDDDNEARLTGSLAALCQAAQPFDLSVNLEFIPWTGVPDVSTAVRVVGACGQPNAAILVDALHYARSRSSLAEIKAIPPKMLNHAQICDAPADYAGTMEGLIHTARYERLLPGEGAIDLVGLFGVLPARLPISIEVPHVARARAVGTHVWVQQAMAAAQRVIQEVESSAANTGDELNCVQT